MSAISKIWNRVYEAIRADPRQPRLPFRIPDDHVIYSNPMPAVGDSASSRIRASKDYLLVILNQLFLADSRRWFTEIEPVVFASSEFIYNGVSRTDPVVIGPSPDNKLPAGTVLRNMPVFGPHPYVGGAFTFTFVLSRLPVGNVARDILQLVEAVSTTLTPALGVATYARMGSVLVNGFERLLELDGIKPLLGLQESVNPDAGQPFDAGRWALIDEDDPRPEQFWVVDDTLMRGQTREVAKPYRDADFILYQIARPPDGRRGDVEVLPIQTLWKSALEAASKADAWAEAKANFAAMISAVAVSPDLTWDHGQQLIAERREQLVALRDVALKTATLSQGDGSDSLVQSQIANVLELG